MSEILPCFVCGSTIDSAIRVAERDCPCATSFRATGNYGSGVFDPMDGSFLEINICDGCLRLNSERVAECQARTGRGRVGRRKWGP